MPALLAGMTLVACTPSGTIGPSAAPTDHATAAPALSAQRYAEIVYPIDPAIETFTSESGALPDRASVDDFVLIARPFANVVAKIDAGLEQTTWPAAARPHIRIQLAADRRLRSYLLGTLDVTLMIALWRNQILGAAKRVRAARRMVSIDLGILPPPPS